MKKAWYATTFRWAQTNITEIDSIRYDIPWWREQWKRTKVQGVIINAGGIVAYYQSKFPLTYTSPFLGERDLFKELVDAAKEEGLVVLARMDSNRVDENFYMNHPDWIAVDSEGRPYTDGEKYITCIHSPYYHDYLPQILLEIGEKYCVDGFTDNSYSGLGQEAISYSPYAKKRFKKATGYDLPKRRDWDDPIFQAWIRFSYKERSEIWTLNDQTVQDAFGQNCRWVGMINGDVVVQNNRLRDLVEIGKYAPIVMLDYQSRTNPIGFRENAVSGKILHELVGWTVLIPESMAMYQHADVAFRLGAKPPAEAIFWAVSGFAGGIQPWWHHIAAYHEDRRAYQTPLPLLQWHEKNERYLVNRTPVAFVGVVYSTNSIDFYGRDEKYLKFTCPFEGINQSLSDGHVLFRVLHSNTIPTTPEILKVLIFPNLGAMTDDEIDRTKQYVENGGSVIITGETGAYDENGAQREKYPFEDMLGITYSFAHHGTEKPAKNTWQSWDQHSYVRLHPENRGAIEGPHIEGEPIAEGPRHSVLQSFEETDILAFGGRVECVTNVDPNNTVGLTFIPPFPVYPPEFSWMRYPDSNIPALIVKETKNGGRVVYMPADFDRQYFLHRHPDHKHLLQNCIQWALKKNNFQLTYEGDLDIDCNLYKQGDEYVLHLVNLTGTCKQQVESYVPCGPITVNMKIDEQDAFVITTLVGMNTLYADTVKGGLSFTIPKIEYHEVCVIKKR
jgi:hypothetical protein